MSHFERTAFANSIATAGDLRPMLIEADIPLFGYLRTAKAPNERVRIYIEGDGFAFVTSTSPSPDPTPLDPTALRLAAADPSESILYLARPCQFTDARANRCPERLWTTHRYSREVLALYHQALDNLRHKLSVTSFELVGYSGGGVIAALLAAERSDVTRLITVAANLDVVAFNRHHGAAPMPQSLNPADFAGKLAAMPQLHLVGSEDRIVPIQIVRAFLKRQKLSGEVERSRLKVIQGAKHTGPWNEALGSMTLE